MRKLSRLPPHVPALAWGSRGVPLTRSAQPSGVGIRRVPSLAEGHTQVRRFGRGIWVLVAACAFAPGPLAHAEPGVPPDVQHLAAENARLAARIAELEARIADLQAENDDLKIVAGVAPPPVGPAAAAKEPPQVTDTVAGNTRTVSAPGGLLKITHGSQADHWVGFRYQRPADARSGPVQVIAMDLRTKFSGRVYRNVKTLVLSIDGEDVDCPVTAYRARLITGGGTRKRIKKHDEFLSVAISTSAVDRILMGRQVGGRLGPVRFALTTQQLAALRVLRKSLDD